jgi:tRNA threonylcarbamoyladenosine modification (KEOPS) complex  Pcc1 subunit
MMRLAVEHERLMVELEAAMAVGDVSLSAIVNSNLRAIEAQMMAIDAAEKRTGNPT